MIVYDASAFFERILKKNLDLRGFILDLSLYEIGNVVLKHYSKLKKLDKKESESILKISSNWKNLIYIHANDLNRIFDLALNTETTFYDASYIYFSKKYEATLETCDKNLYEKASKVCKCKLLKQ